MHASRTVTLNSNVYERLQICPRELPKKPLTSQLINTNSCTTYCIGEISQGALIMIATVQWSRTRLKWNFIWLFQFLIFLFLFSVALLDRIGSMPENAARLLTHALVHDMASRNAAACVVSHRRHLKGQTYQNPQTGTLRDNSSQTKQFNNFFSTNCLRKPG